MLGHVTMNRRALTRFHLQLADSTIMQLEHISCWIIYIQPVEKIKGLRPNCTWMYNSCSNVVAINASIVQTSYADACSHHTSFNY